MERKEKKGASTAKEMLLLKFRTPYLLHQRGEREDLIRLSGAGTQKQQRERQRDAGETYFLGVQDGYVGSEKERHGEKT